jgi:hypothetical protein
MSTSPALADLAQGWEAPRFCNSYNRLSVLLELLELGPKTDDEWLT